MTFSVFCAQQLSAQESMTPDTYEANDEKERGEPINSTGEQTDHKSSFTPLLKDPSDASATNSVAPKTVTQQRVNTTIKPPTENTKPETKQTADDSILSFNFLYYIIQKYKLQDIVD